MIRDGCSSTSHHVHSNKQERRREKEEQRPCVKDTSDCTWCCCSHSLARTWNSCKGSWGNDHWRLQLLSQGWSKALAVGCFSELGEPGQYQVSLPTHSLTPHLRPSWLSSSSFAHHKRPREHCQRQQWAHLQACRAATTLLQGSILYIWMGLLCPLHSSNRSLGGSLRNLIRHHQPSAAPWNVLRKNGIIKWTDSFFGQ